jgi:hypothetical protein
MGHSPSKEASGIRSSQEIPVIWKLEGSYHVYGRPLLVHFPKQMIHSTPHLI